MRATTFFKSLLSGVAFLALAGTATAGDVDVNGSVGVASGRVFQDQAIELDHPVVELDLNGCLSNGICGDLWTAQPLESDHDEVHENDVAVWKDSRFGDVVVRTKVLYIEIKGKDDWDGSVAVTMPLSTNCSGTVSGEVMRGGFNDNVAKLGASCTWKMADKTTVTVDPTIAHSDWNDGYSAGLTARISYELPSGATLSGFVKSFKGERDSAAIFGVSVGRTF